MPGKSRAEKFNSLVRRQDCFFIGDDGLHEYHYKDCAGLDDVVKKNLAALGKNPEQRGYKPCPFCKPRPIQAASKGGNPEKPKNPRCRLYPENSKKVWHERASHATEYLHHDAGR